MTTNRPAVSKWLTGDWLAEKTGATLRRRIGYSLTILWFTATAVTWLVMRDALLILGLVSLYAIWISHLAGWASERPVEEEADP